MNCGETSNRKDDLCYMNRIRALDEVRRKVQREFNSYDRKKLKRMRHVLYSEPLKLSEKDCMVEEKQNPAFIKAIKTFKIGRQRL